MCVCKCTYTQMYTYTHAYEISKAWEDRLDEHIFWGGKNKGAQDAAIESALESEMAILEGIQLQKQ